MRVGVIGGSGYAGGELLRLLDSHPEFSVEFIGAGSSAGEEITSIHSHLTSYSGMKFQSTDISIINSLDLVFLALPHGESASLAKDIDSPVKVVDLGADFRLGDSSQWTKYYGGTYAGQWCYGLPEIPRVRDKIKNSTRVANPGCYATSIALAAAPALQAGAIDGSDIVVVASSGTTGAGRSTKVSLSASEIMNSMTSYKFGGVHQHTPEIEETLSGLTKNPVKISFTPILAPMPRGILATVTAKTTSDYSTIRALYEKTYSAEKFVTLLPEGRLPETSSLIGSNSAHMQIAVDAHTSRLIVSIAIDNLGKGAAGQAIQNANLISGFAEDLALPTMGLGQ